MIEHTHRVAGFVVGAAVALLAILLWLTEPDGKVSRLAEPLADPYWPAYEHAVREGWS